MNSNSEPEYMTIREAVIFTGKSERTLYRYIKQGKLKCLTPPVIAGQMPDNNKQSVRVRKEELIRMFNISTGILPDSYRHTPDNMPGSAGQILDNACQLPDNNQHMSGTYRQGLLTKDDIKEILKDNLKDVITTNKLQEFFESKQAELVKPLEQQSLVLVGELRNEVKHLRAEKEALLQENELLRTQIKALPGPVELENKDNMILLLEKEKETFQSALKEHEVTIKEKERTLKELDDLHRQELEKLKQQAEEEKKKLQSEAEAEKDRLKTEAEEREKQISEAWKKELELARRPWWKLW